MKKNQMLAVACATVCAGSLFTGCSVTDKIKSLIGSDTEFQTSYVQSVLDVSYKGNLTDYMDNTEASEEDAQDVYDSTVEYYATYLTYSCDVDTENIDEDINKQFTEIAKDILLKADYQVTKSENGKDSCYVTVQVKPLDIISQMDDDITACVDEYNAKIDAITEEELAEMTDDDFTQIENEYANNIVSALRKCADSPQYGESVDIVIEIVKDENDVYGCANDNDWDDLDDRIMGID